MKLNYSKIFITAVLTTILTIGVSYVSAQSPNQPQPSETYTQELPLHTTIGLQVKKGGIWSKTRIGAPIGFFKKSIFLPGTNSKLRIGSASGAVNLNSALFGDNSSEPLVIDLQSRSASQSGTRFINGNQCSVATRLVNDKAAAFEFRTGANPGNIIARQVQLSAGNPGKDKVLVSDANGNARWAKASVVNGQVVFSSGVSPVIEGQTCVTPPPADMCPNITGTQTSIPAGMALDTNGNCVTDMCSNITGPQSTVPAGYYVDGSGSCLTLRYWTCAPQGVNGWFESKPPGNNYNLPVKIANTSSPYFNTPYCSVANYRPGDKYYRQYDSICAEHSVTPDTSACYPTGNTPIAPSCTGTTYSQPCNP